MPDPLAPTALLPRDDPFTLLKAGREALREVPRLRRFLFIGFTLTYGIFFVLGVLGAIAGYRALVRPLAAWLEPLSAAAGEWQGVASVFIGGVLWLAQLVLLAASLYVAFQIALAMMSFWLEALVRRIVSHWRPGELLEAPFRLEAWLRSVGRSLIDSLGLILMSILALFLGFIPVVGPALVVIVNSWLLGREVRDPYLNVLETLGQDRRALSEGLSGWTFQTGLLPAVVGLVPFAGWVLLPVCMIHLVAGFAWQGERARRG